MMALTPYRLQTFVTEEMRHALRHEAHAQETSMQKLVRKILYEYLKQRPSGQHLQLEEEGG